MICPNCGSNITDNSRFCINCGCQLSGEQSGSVSEQTAQTQEAPQNQPPVQAQGNQYYQSSNAQGGFQYQQNSNAQYGPQYQQAPPPVTQIFNQVPTTIPPEYKPIGAWGYFGWQLLFCIPLVGIILLIVFSVGGTSNINLRNFARSHFCTLALALIIVAILILTGLTGLGCSSAFAWWD